MDSLLTDDACTLRRAERRGRLAEFDELFATAVRQAEFTGDTVRLRLTGDAGLEDRVRDLAARETACCSYFSFAIDGTDKALTVDISVPHERAELLDGIAVRARQLSA